MWIEQSNFEANRNKYIDFRDAFSDSLLSEQEQTDIEQSYYQECEQIHDDAQTLCDELQNEILQYQSMTEMSREEVKDLQIISWAQDIDGLRGPNTFAYYKNLISLFWNLNIKSPKETYNVLYSHCEDIFNSQDTIDEKKNIQKSAWSGTDWVFWPNTFQAIMQNIHNSNELQDLFLSKSVLTIEDETNSLNDVIGNENMSEKNDELLSNELIEWSDGDLNLQKNWENESVNTTWEKNESITNFQNPENIEINTLRLWMTEIEFEAAKTAVKNSSEYIDASKIAKKLSSDQKKNIQMISWAHIDWQFWPETFLYFKSCELYQAWFSLEETADSKKIVTQSDLETLLWRIQSTYNVSEDITNEMFWPLSIGDYILYDVLWWEMTHYDIESWRKWTINVAKGINDSISEAFTQNDFHSILNTLNRIGDSSEKIKYIEMLFSYIMEQELFNEARSMFTTKSIIAWRDTYTIDFKWNKELGDKFTANILFNDQDYLISNNEAYSRQWENYISIDWSNKRLELKNNSEISIPTEADKNHIDTNINESEQKDIVKNKIEDNLIQVFEQWDVESILLYCKLFSDAKKRVLLYNIKQLSRTEHWFDAVRNVFAVENSNWNFIFQSFKDAPWVGLIFENGLTAFDLFWDYKTVESNWTQYHSISDFDYTSAWNRLSIREGSEINIVESSFREESEFKKIGENPQLSGELGKWIQRNYVNNWNNSCWASCWDAMTNFWIRGLPQYWRDWYKWKWFLEARPNQFTRVAISHPNEAKPGWIVTYWQNAERWTNVRKKYWHVEIKGLDWDFYSYYHSNIPGGSSRSQATWNQYKRHTWFEWFAYYPKSRA